MTSSLSTERQFGIWRSRVFREIDKCADITRLCPGAEFYELAVDEDGGRALTRFRVFVPFREGSSALSLVPLTALEISMPFDPHHASASFPFRPPRVRVYIGAETLPREIRQTCSETGETLLELPTLAHWSPSNTLVMILQDFVTVVQQHDAPSSVTGGGNDPAYTASGGKPTKRLRMRKRDVYGAIYHCQEVEARTGMLRPVPMLLQSGNIVLLVPPPSKTAIAAARRANGGAAPIEDDPDHVFVSDLFPLKDIARITPQRGKSITFFFKNQRSPCRTLLTSQTEAIVADIQRMIAAVSSNKRGREGGDASTRSPRHPRNESSTDDGAFSQLLSFLSPEHTEKAKEVSNKIVGKLSRWGSSVSKFFKGDDDAHEAEPQCAGRDPAFHELDRMKSDFFHYPSRAKMVAITTRYQQLAESLAQRNNRDGQVEKAVEEMQAFIEHPATQRLLLESYAIDSAQRGIRVGSL